MKFRATAPRGFADLLARELAACGALELRERATGVLFAGPLECAYRACLWSRIANRVFLELAQFVARDADEFYAALRGIDWTAHLGPGTTLACGFSGRHPTILHSHFGALRLKDGIVDALREATGARPDIDTERPGVRVQAHATGIDVVLSIDLSGESLHRRGYRGAAGDAPLKENVAAGVLLRSGWAELAAQGAEFLDPLCGSGTLCIEAALLAADRAPGLRREYFGFLGWRGHDAPLWAQLRADAEARAARGVASAATVRGSDRDERAIRAARDNAVRAGVAGLARFDTAALADAAPVAGRAPGRPGLLCTNPPYGVRMQQSEGVQALHRELGAVLRERFEGWDASILTGAAELGRELGLRAHRTHRVWNGAIECHLLRIRVGPESTREPGRLGTGASRQRDTPGARMFANRLGKNLQRLGRWARRAQVSCYRLYDADMPEYAFAIDLYRTLEPEEPWLYVQEYEAPSEIEPHAVRQRRGEVLAVLPEVTSVPPERIRVRTRRRARRGEQYRKLDDRAHSHLVGEGGLRFWVNFDDYLDTGLFLDHRMTRARLRAAARGARFLNLFAYTGTATVYAVAGGAQASTSVDLSRTYLEWAQRNLTANGFAGKTHAWVQADCRAWLRDARRDSARFDLVFLDPPTFSNSARMEGVLDIVRDHAALVDDCAQLLTPAGCIVFSTNAQRLRLDEGLGQRYDVRDMSAATLPKDFERHPRIHQCFEIRLRS